MTFAIAYPYIDPVLFELGPVVIRWYSLAYIAGLLLGFWYMARLATFPPAVITDQQIWDFMVWAILGVILGGRLGYVIFYKPEFFIDNPGEILAVWRGGMSFHGGFLGVVIGGLLFARKHKIPALGLADLCACVAPIGLGLGRIANFINGELYGRITDVPWAMVFPRGGPMPRHPSQLYEAALEGLVLVVVLHLVWRREALRQRIGLLTGVFLAGYGLFRIIAEFYRQPDVHLGFLSFGTTMGQWLSLPMLLAGLFLIVRSKPAPAT
jgi:phosphatidylglycerol:prolipoprotein diacylglycerol transferase